MKGKYCVLIIIFFVFMLLCSPLSAEFTYQVDFTSRYIWRGFDLNPNKQPAMQPSIEYSCEGCGFTLNLWGNISFNNKDFHEIDLSFTYDFKISRNFSLNAGFIFYGWYFVDNFSFKDNTSQEIFISAGFPMCLFHPRLTVFYDFGNGDGIYVLFEGYYSHEFSKQIKTVFQASAGYNGGQWLPDGVDPGLSDLNLGFLFQFKTGRFEISPFLKYTFVFLDAIGNENHFWFGISVKYK